MRPEGGWGRRQAGLIDVGAGEVGEGGEGVRAEGGVRRGEGGEEGGEARRRAEEIKHLGGGRVRREWLQERVRKE